MSDQNHKIKVFIPDWYEIYGDALKEVIAEAVKGLEVVSAQIKPGTQGNWLYLWNQHFPFTSENQDAPEAEIFLSASKGWRVKWNQVIKSDILTR